MKLGFIGCGNMAKAMMGGIIQKKVCPAENIMASDLFAPALEKAGKDLGIRTTQDNNEVVAFADVIVLPVKPQFPRLLLSRAESGPEIAVQKVHAAAFPCFPTDLLKQRMILIGTHQQRGSKMCESMARRVFRRKVHSYSIAHFTPQFI